MEKLMYADELKPGDRFMLNDGKTTGICTRVRVEMIPCGSCDHKTVPQIRIEADGVAYHRPNNPREVVTLLHRPHEYTEEVDAFHESVKRACLAVVDAGFVGKGREKAIAKAHAALEAYLLAFPEKAFRASEEL